MIICELRSNKGREFEKHIGTRNVQRFSYFGTDTTVIEKSTEEAQCNGNRRSEEGHGLNVADKKRLHCIMMNPTACLVWHSVRPPGSEKKKKVKQSHYRPGVARRVPGS